MEQINLTKSRRMAEDYLDDHLQESLAAETDEDRRRLLQTLYTRQKGSLEYLSLIRLDMGKSAAFDDEPDEPGKLTKVLTHPFFEALLPLLVLVFVLLEMEAATLVAAILCFCRGVMRLTHRTYGKRAQFVPEVHEPYLLESDMQRFLARQTDRIAADAASIADRHVVTISRERRGVADDAVEMYCALYEAYVDSPEQETLTYPLSMAKMSLLERGMEPVMYAPETAALFDVLPSDCSDQMRYPAIRSRENGAVIRRGLFLRSREGGMR